MNILYFGYLFGLYIMGLLSGFAWTEGHKKLSISGIIGFVLILFYDIYGR